MASTAVVVYARGSAAGFSELAGGSTRYSIYKNGALANAGDLRPYDVAIYSPSTNAIRVCDTRITGVYENASPNLSNPTTITVMGHQFTVLSTAADTMTRLPEEVKLALPGRGALWEACKTLAKQLGVEKRVFFPGLEPDMRYAIDPAFIHQELGWLPETKFIDGLEKTVRWYLDNRPWWEHIINGEYQTYYERMYGNR